jgi:hypothetical protein
MSFKASSQEDAFNVEAVDQYKYIIIPLKFQVFKYEDKYQINSLTKFLFNKYGYTAYLENDAYPKDLSSNNCLALTADVVKVKGGFLSTRVQINLMDCNGTLVSSSKVGKSREKEFKVAYNLAVRDAFETFQIHNYNYKPDAKVISLASNESGKSNQKNEEETVSAQKEIERLKQEVAALKEKKEDKKNVIVGELKTSSKEENGNQPLVIDEELKASSKETTKDKSNEIVVELKSSSEVDTVDKVNKVKEDLQMLYAQPIENGFQIVDSTPKVVMILLETPKENTFIVKDQNAIVYKQDGFWYLSKNDGSSKTLETLNIKF